MAAPISATVRDAMRARAQKIKDNIAKGQQGGAFTRMWNLQGQNTIVAAGGEVIVRLMPRWDRYIVQNGKVVSSAAALELPIYVPAFEHWWDSSDGKRVREWCPVIANEDGTLEGDCPICEAAAELKTSSSKEDKELGYEIRAKEIVLFNAMVGPLGARAFNDGKPDIRPIPLMGSLFFQVSDIMTGGEHESFARGDISDPADGYDLKLSRPSAKGDRWKVDCAEPSRLFGPTEAANWKGWWEMIANLDEVLEKETKTYEELHQLFHEVKAAPAAAPARGRGVAAPAAVEDDMPGMGGGPSPEAPSGDEGGELDLEGLDDMPGAGPAPAAAPARAPARRAPSPAAPAAVSRGHRGAGRGRR